MPRMRQIFLGHIIEESLYYNIYRMNIRQRYNTMYPNRVLMYTYGTTEIFDR